MVSTMKDQCQDIRMLPSHAEPHLDTKGCWQKCLLRYCFSFYPSDTGEVLVKLCSKSREVLQITQRFDFIPFFGESYLPNGQDSQSPRVPPVPSSDSNAECEINAQSWKFFASEVSNTGWVIVSFWLFRTLSRKHLIMGHLRAHCLL